MSRDDHKIDADDRNVFEVLNERKYTVDYFQREYSWEQKHIEQLVTDLTSSFIDVYKEGDPRPAVEHYNNYYLGPFVVSSKDGARSIIDGQQRLTSITLFLIFLNHLQNQHKEKGFSVSESIEPLIFSERFGEKSFNIQVEERRACLEKLYKEGHYEIRENDDESTINMVNRYNNIAEAFPEEIDRTAFPYFLDWLKYNVVLVEITAYSDDNAYTIFEAMNDRGLNLTSSEMLKGYILSRFRQPAARAKANVFWRDSIQELHAFGKDEDQQFFQAWLRSQYAESIRPSKAGSANEDFERIGTRFHSWVRDNLVKMGLRADSPDGFENFVHKEMRFFVGNYLGILKAQKEELSGWEQVYYSHECGIAQSLAAPLMLAPLISSDDPETVREKIIVVAKYIETFAILRSVNFRTYGASSIRYTMNTLIKEIRRADLDKLKAILRDRLEAMDESWDGFSSFRMHGMNRWFVKYLLSRVTAYVENKAGIGTTFSTYYVKSEKKPFEVEHIWADKFDEHRNEFDQQNEFDNFRNRIGDLLLLPRGTNQSYGAMRFGEKVEHYLKENLWAKSLHPMAYENNPNFTAMAQSHGFPFKPYGSFSRADIEERQNLMKTICESMWGSNL